MSIFIDTTYRSTETELMDDFTLEGDLLRDTLDKLGSINKWLGGNSITLKGIKTLLKDKEKDQTYRIVDLGCGHGDMLRLIADFGRENGYEFKLIGIDANTDTIEYARELSIEYGELSYDTMDIFSEAFSKLDFDIALSTLFLHHFEDERILKLLGSLAETAKIGIVVNDLHRSELAYGLFKVLGLFISNSMVVQDGLTSILRAFKRKDFERIATELNLNSKIHWKWAFRYQWLIKT